jgi:hypothetical protein
MTLHPAVVIDGHFLDITMPKLHRMKLRNNEVLEESEEDVEWVDDAYHEWEKANKKEDGTFIDGVTRADCPNEKESDHGECL